jgi:hypothetical protein
VRMLSITLALASFAALAAPGDGPLKDVSAIRIGNYGAPSKQVHSREELAPALAELNELRGRQWKQADTRLSCYSTLTLMNGPKTVAIYRVTNDTVVERPAGKNDLAYSIAVTEADLPKIRKHLAESAPAICK